MLPHELHIHPSRQCEYDSKPLHPDTGFHRLSPIMSWAGVWYRRTSIRRNARSCEINEPMPITANFLSPIKARWKARWHSARARTTEELAAAIEQQDKPSKWIAEQLRKRRGASDGDVVKALQLLLDKRSVVLTQLFRENAGTSIETLPDAWVALKRAELARTPLSGAEFETIRSLLPDRPEKARAAKIVSRLMLSAIIAQGSCDDLAIHLETLPSEALEKLPLSVRLRLVQRLRNCPDSRETLQRALESVERETSEFNRLKLKNVDYLCQITDNEWLHSEAEADFARTANPPLAAQYNERIQPIYDSLRPRMTHMEVRSNVKQREQILNMFLTALERREPLSLLRLSDGEGYLFPDGTDVFWEDERNRERHWWGCELDDAQRRAIRSCALDAVASADIVGIPSVFRLFRDFMDFSKSLDQTPQTRGLVRVLSGAPPTVCNGTIITEDKVNVALFSDIQIVAKLAKVADRVVVVSSMRQNALPPELQEIPTLQAFNIPTHNYTVTNSMYYAGEQKLPFVYGETIQALGQSVKPGTLVIIAGGIIGKIFVGEARKLGGVVIDIGHVLDDWCTKSLPGLR